MNKLKIRFNCKDLTSNLSPVVFDNGSSVSLLHHSEDPLSVNRLIVSINDFEVEILPSKGFSVGQVYRKGKPIFWKPPIGHCDPEILDLFSDEVAINGTPAPGFTFLKTFSGGIEFYGLRNWGMPFFDDRKKFLHPLHGETSNIPVDFCDIEINDKEIKLIASFVYRDIPNKSTGIWYLQGGKLFEVERQVIIRKDQPQLKLIDRVKNISKESLKPDWGYHITFLPADGSRLLVPSTSLENRSGNKVPEDFDSWSHAKNSQVREETGIIYKGLETIPSENGNLSYVLVVHPGHTGIKVSFPASPYFQTWFSRGGAYSDEFTKVSEGKPLFTKNWDGLGIEFGASTLDHDGNTDPSVPEQASVEPGSSIVIPLLFSFIEGCECRQLAEEVNRFNENRTVISIQNRHKNAPTK